MGYVGPLTFDIAVVNIGEAMNLNTGLFRAPRDGIYFFVFSAQAGFLPPGSMDIVLYVSNNITRPMANYHAPPDMDWTMSSMQALVFLKSGEEVGIRIVECQSGFLQDSPGKHLTNFVGFLLKEDIVFN